MSADNGPAAIVQRFVTASSVAGNGYVACTYLTSAEQRAMSPPGSGQGCRQALNVGGLVLGGRAIDSVHALHRLRVTQSIHGAHATVRLSDGRAGVDFHLVRVHDGELGEYRAPNSAWRISSGAQALEHPASPSAAGTALAVRFDTRAAR